MINSSMAFRRAINKNGRVMSIQDVYTFSDGSQPKLKTGNFRSYSVNMATSGSSSFDIGATIIKEYKATLDNTEGTFDTYDFEGLDIWARVGLLLEDETTEIIPKGKFRCVEAKNSENSINIKAYDSMLFFDRPYSESKLRFPATINQIILNACLCCGMTYDASTIQNGNYIVMKRPEDESLTFRDVLGFCAQIMCCYAYINHLDKLAFGWYDFETLTNLQNSYDGGSFSYADGKSLDGGNFTDYASGDSLDGGTFEEQKDYHHLFSLGSRSINTDDVQITGIAVTPESNDSELYMCGEDGYVLMIEGNPFIQSGQDAQMIAEDIGEKMNGKRFRPLNVSCKSNPCIEAGDCACVTDRKNRTYFTVITNTTFSLGSLQTVECTAETPTEKNYTKYSAVTKLLNKAKNDTKKQLNEYDLVVQQLTRLMTQSFGVFKTEEKKEDGSIIYYMHNKPLLGDSSTIWKMTADAFAVSTDGGETWNAGIDAEGNTVVNVLNAIGINANWILTGLIADRLGKNKWNLDTGDIQIESEYFKLKEGKVTASEVDISGSFKSSDGTGSGTTEISNGTVSVGTGATKVGIGNAGMAFSHNDEGVARLNIFGLNYSLLISLLNNKGFALNDEDSSWAEKTVMFYNTDGGHYIMFNRDIYGYAAEFTDTEIVGSLTVKGTKSRLASTENYSNRLLYCYETPSPMFGDIGEGIIDETGKCYIFLDDIFAETIDTDCTYQVFLQSYGRGECYVTERTASYFIVEGTENLSFGWELKGIQRDFDTIRLEEYQKQGAQGTDVTVETYKYLTTLLYDVETEEIENE